VDCDATGVRTENEDGNSHDMDQLIHKVGNVRLDG